MNTIEKTRNIGDIFADFPGRSQSDLIPLLQAVQEEMGYLSRESIREVSAFLGLPASKIYGVATFYNQFRLSPPGRHLIQVCRGTACHVKGSQSLLEALERELGVKVGQTTRDERFTLEMVACLGACSIAPVICIDGNFHGRVKMSELPEILAQYE